MKIKCMKKRANIHSSYTTQTNILHSYYTRLTEQNFLLVKEKKRFLGTISRQSISMETDSLMTSTAKEQQAAPS